MSPVRPQKTGINYTYTEINNTFLTSIKLRKLNGV